MGKDYIKIENIDIWARVGVLKHERIKGQLFNLDVVLWSDFDSCVEKDDLSQTIDYSILVNLIRSHAERFSCYTIEKYSNVIINLLIESFNPDRIKIILMKCHPPINGFNGNVSITRFYKK